MREKFLKKSLPGLKKIEFSDYDGFINMLFREADWYDEYEVIMINGSKGCTKKEFSSVSHFRRKIKLACGETLPQN